MTNEELAVKAKNREEWAVLELWEAVQRFAMMKARKYMILAGPDCRAEYEDLVQDGFIAMMDAIEDFDIERGGSFIGSFNHALQKRFAEEGRHRSSKRDALQYAISADLPAYPDDPEGETIAEAAPDPCGEYAFMLVEYDEFIQYTRRLLKAALSSLPALQRGRIVKHYYYGARLDSISGKRTTIQAVCASMDRGLKYLRRGKYHRELLEALRGFDDFRELQRHDIRSSELKSLAHNPKYKEQ